MSKVSNPEPLTTTGNKSDGIGSWFGRSETVLQHTHVYDPVCKLQVGLLTVEQESEMKDEFIDREV